MAATILDGKALARDIQAEIAADAVKFMQQGGPRPTLAAVLVGEDAASQVYIRHKQKACEKVGLASRLHKLAADTTEEQLLTLLAELNADAEVHGILVQLPVPEQINTQRVLEAVSPLKDVDAFHPENVGRIVQGQPRFLPCTPHGILQMLTRNNIETAGRRAVIVGRSDIVGKPMANMLLQRGVDATVTVCHSRTQDLPAVTREAELLIVAIGRANFITGEMIRPGAAVIDVGMNRLESGLAGDVEFESAKEVAGSITPVPGGVGPLTVTMLLYNTLAAARLQQTSS